MVYWLCSIKKNRLNLGQRQDHILNYFNKCIRFKDYWIINTSVTLCWRRCKPSVVRLLKVPPISTYGGITFDAVPPLTYVTDKTFFAKKLNKTSISIESYQFCIVYNAQFFLHGSFIFVFLSKTYRISLLKRKNDEVLFYKLLKNFKRQKIGQLLAEENMKGTQMR